MKVLIDISRMHKLSLKRGIGSYTQNLFNSLKKYTSVDAMLSDNNPDYKKYDLIHIPFFDPFVRTLKIDSNIPTVVTIHDLIPIMFPKHYPSGIRGKLNWQFQKREIKKAKKIIAVSNTVKKDIEEILKFNSQQIAVTYQAAEEIFIEKSSDRELSDINKKYNLPENFVLYIGNINWNKNILNMTEGVVRSGHNLVIIGNAFKDKSNLNHPEKKNFKTWLEKYENNNSISVLDFVEDKELVKIMHLAKCLIFVSFYEGFGLPILEAQTCGLPVITSKIGAMKEIAGEGALLANPEDPQDIKNTIQKVFDSDELREKLVKKGFENIKKFSWKETAIKTFEAYKNAFG